MPDGGATGEQQAIDRPAWIVGPAYDSLLLIGAPPLFLLVGALVWALGIQDASFSLGERTVWVFPAFALTFTMAHVVAVFFRSHGNVHIFRLHRWRFTVVPLALFGLFVVSKTAFLFGLVFATWFDNYHSSMQTFGIGRLYDMRAGNDALAGRRLDMGLALVTFMGPILAGATLPMSLTDFAKFSEVGLMELTRVPGWVLAQKAWITWPVLAAGLAYIVFYVVAYVRLGRRGYRYSKQKVALWVALALTSLWMWGFDSFGQAFLVMESFHSLQYFALLWWSERKNLSRLFRTAGRRHERTLTLAGLLVPPFAFGLWCSIFWATRIELALFLVVELMHYWWDGFIWSVRNKQVG
jgi:hypothetical protein